MFVWFLFVSVEEDPVFSILLVNDFSDVKYHSSCRHIFAHNVQTYLPITSNITAQSIYIKMYVFVYVGFIFCVFIGGGRVGPVPNLGRSSNIIFSHNW